MFSRLHLTLTAALAFLAGAVALVVSALVFGEMTEDVTQHNGFAARDAANLKFFTLHRDAIDVHAAKVVTEIGSVPVVAALALLAGIFLWRHGERVVIALAPIGALALAATVAGVAKLVIGRSRPPVALHLVTESDASFPSGHATNSAALFMTIAFVVALFVLRRPLARVATVFGAGLLVGAIGASRLVLGVHWPSDVVAGLALGMMCALVVTIAATVFALRGPMPAFVAGEGFTQPR